MVYHQGYDRPRNRWALSSLQRVIKAPTIEAVVENGLLRPMQPLPFKENEQVRITIEPKENWVPESYGLCGWKGNADELRQLALAPDLDLEEEP